MEIKTKGDEKKLEIELIEEDHTFCNLLTKTLHEDPQIKFAAYDISHPYVSEPVVHIETNGDKSTYDALIEAIEKIINRAEEFKENLRNTLKQ